MLNLNLTFAVCGIRECSNCLLVEIQPFKNSKFIEKIHNVHRGLDKCLAIHTILFLFYLGLIDVEIL